MRMPPSSPRVAEAGQTAGASAFASSGWASQPGAREEAVKRTLT
jgi:hypothetical protein